VELVAAVALLLLNLEKSFLPQQEATIGLFPMACIQFVLYALAAAVAVADTVMVLLVVELLAIKIM
jgi:hypothetical protein